MSIGHRVQPTGMKSRGEPDQAYTMPRDGRPQHELYPHRSHSFPLFPDVGISRHDYGGLMGPPELPKPIDPPVIAYQTHRQIPSSSSMPLVSLFPSSPVPDPNPHWNLSPTSRDYLPSTSPPSLTNPINRWQVEDGPWTGLHGTVPKERLRQHVPFVQSGVRSSTFGQYRDNSMSEVESVTGTHPSDSGYATKSLDARSAFSGEPLEYGQDCGSIAGQVDNLNLMPEQGEDPPPFGPSSRQDFLHQSPIYGPTGPRISNYMCPVCGEAFNCQSALKKHHLRHQKPFKCPVLDCPKKHEGFATVNDLDRHTLSVHKFVKNGIVKKYRCPFHNCKSRDKTWPRLDNFRSHLRRIHKDSQIEEFVRRCEEFLVKETDPVDPSPDSLISGEPGPAIGASTHNITSEEQSFVKLGDISSVNSSQANAGAGSPGSHFVLTNNSEADASVNFRGGDPIRPKFEEPNFPQVDKLADDPMEDASCQVGEPSPTNSENVQGNMICLDDIQSSEDPIEPPSIICSQAPTGPAIGKTVGVPSQISKDDPDVDLTNHREVESAVKYMSSKIQEIIHSMSPDFLVEANLKERNCTGSEVILLDENESNKAKSTIGAGETNQADTVSKLPNPGQVSHQISTGIMNPASSLKAPLPEKVMLQIQELLKAGFAKVLSPQKPRFLQSSGSTIGGKNGPIHAKGKVQCKHCQKVLPRDCDMKKHLKRHTRPFGCTFKDCNKVFGSKNDWKRHENSQHFQLETWRCHEEADGKECAKLFYRRENFQTHLRQQHNIHDQEKLKDEARARRIGRNGQIQFWCGFCKKIIPLKNRGLEAWDERFNHIGKHFGDHLKIDHWVPIDSDRPKGELWSPEKDHSDGESQQPQQPQQQQQQQQQQRPRADIHVALLKLAEEAAQPVEQPRPPVKDVARPASQNINVTKTATPRRVTKEDLVRYCCECNDGPHSAAVHSKCPDCNHEYCHRCSATSFPAENQCELDEQRPAKREQRPVKRSRGT